MLPLAELDAFASEVLPSPGAVPFVEFCEHLGVALDEKHGTLGQRVAALVAYDGLDPRDLRGKEREYARIIFGDIDVIPKSARDVVVGICGGRAGKSYVLEALRLLHLGLTVDISELAPGEVGSVPIIAPDKDLAQQILNYIAGAIESDHALRALRVGDALEESVTIHRDGHDIEFVIRAASARGRTGRGRSLLAAALDEAAFFRDASYKVNDREMYDAVQPRIMPGGQLLIFTTPWTQAGLAFELFVANYPNPERAGVLLRGRREGTAIAMHAPTLVMRDVAYTRALVAKATAVDPLNAEREYGAQFTEAGTAAFFDAAAIARMIDESLPLEPVKPQPGDVVTAAGDIGLTKNSTALAVGHTRDGVTTLAELLEQKPEQGKPLKPTEVGATFRERLTWHHASYFMADTHYRESAVEALEPAGIGFIDAPDPAEAFVRARKLMNEGHLRVPHHPRLIRQLRETMKRDLPGGKVRIILLKWPTGEHGDLAAAFVLMAYQAHGEEVPPPPPVEGTDAWEERLRAQRVAAKRATAEEPWWKRRGRRT